MKKLIFALGLLSLFTSTFGQTWQTKLYLNLLELGSNFEKAASLRVLREYAGDPRVSKAVVKVLKESDDPLVTIRAIETLSLGGNRPLVYRTLLKIASDDDHYFAPYALSSLYTLSMKSPIVRNYLLRNVIRELKSNIKNLESVKNVRSKVWALRKLVPQHDVRKVLMDAYREAKTISLKEVLINAMFEVRNHREVRDLLFDIAISEESEKLKYSAVIVLKYASLTNQQQRRLSELAFADNTKFVHEYLELLSMKRLDSDLSWLKLDYNLSNRSFNDVYQYN